MQHSRLTKIVFTVGSVMSDEQAIRALFKPRVNAFRLNFRHGIQAEHAQRVEVLCKLEKEFTRPTGVLFDLRGLKPSLGRFFGGKAIPVCGESFRLDSHIESGDLNRVGLPHPEIFAVLQPSSELQLDGRRLRLRVGPCGVDFADTTDIVGGIISERKRLDVPVVRTQEAVKVLTTKLTAKGSAFHSMPIMEAYKAKTCHREQALRGPMLFRSGLRAVLDASSTDGCWGCQESGRRYNHAYVMIKRASP